MAGQIILVTLLFSSVVTQVGIKPMVKPLFGSCAISGMGMKGAVSGLNHFVQAGFAGLGGGGGGAGTGPGGTSDPVSPGGVCAQHGAAQAIAPATTMISTRFT